jgi:hypothetical protein
MTGLELRGRRNRQRKPSPPNEAFVHTATQNGLEVEHRLHEAHGPTQGEPERRAQHQAALDRAVGHIGVTDRRTVRTTT